ncbi:MAG: hypothetical protein AAGE94_20670 [Acidobacteriota bacterium]
MTDNLSTIATRRPAGVWLLASAAVLLAAALPFFQETWSPERLAVLAGAELALACVVAWLFDPVRFAGAMRLLCFLIFLAYLKHMLDEVGGERPAHEAIIGFVVLGLPALVYAVFGRWFPAGPETVVASTAPVDSDGMSSPPAETPDGVSTPSSQWPIEPSSSERPASGQPASGQPASGRPASEASASE